MRARPLAPVLVLLAVAGIAAQRPDPFDRIREADITRDLFALAGDAMRGREAGTLDEMKAAVARLSMPELVGVVASMPLAQQTQEMLRVIARRQAEDRLLEHLAQQPG